MGHIFFIFFILTLTVVVRVKNYKVLSNSTKLCYTYDNLNRVTQKTVKKLSDGSVVSAEAFSYDAAGNITNLRDDYFEYDANNRLISSNGSSINYDLDGNMLNACNTCYGYDSANRLVSTCDHSYTYNAEDVRIRKVTDYTDTSYTYNTNCRLSQLLMTTVNGAVTKYVYGLGLIGEEKSGSFKTYHFDYRGSTVAITNASGAITDTFQYNTYGALVSRTGTTEVIFGYNGRDGVITDENGLIYMRARYYSPLLCRFINADIVPGEISDAVTLNRFAYANGNPVSNIDPFGLSAERGNNSSNNWLKGLYGVLNIFGGILQAAAGAVLGATVGWTGVGAVAAAALVLNGAATTTQGIGQIFNTVTQTNTLREDNIIRTGVQEVGRAVAGDTGATVAGMAYDTAILAAALYSPPAPKPTTTPTQPSAQPTHTKNLGSPKKNVNPGGSHTQLDSSGNIYSYTQFNSSGQQTLRIDFQGKPHAGVLPHVHLFKYPELGGKIDYIFDMEWNLIN